MPTLWCMCDMCGGKISEMARMWQVEMQGSLTGVEMLPPHLSRLHGDGPSFRSRGGGGRRRPKEGRDKIRRVERYDHELQSSFIVVSVCLLLLLLR